MNWQTQHSLIAEVPLEKAWAFHTSIAENWKRIEGDAVESISLDGPYIAGTRGTTKMPGQEPVHWQLTEVEPPYKSTTEMKLSDALLQFTWTFEALTENQTRMTQYIKMEGPDLASYIPFMEKNFAENLEPGMQKIAAEMTKYVNE